MIGDVGQNRFEEIDYETLAGARGANFGWNDFEGFSPFEGADPPTPSRHDRPIKVYPLGGERAALIGGYVVRARALKGLRKRYVYGGLLQRQAARADPAPRRRQARPRHRAARALAHLVRRGPPAARCMRPR